jgi:cyanophycinase
MRVPLNLPGVLFAVLFLVSGLSAQEPEPGMETPPQVGPASGSLVIVGGSMRDPAIRQRFVELAGGEDAHIVVVPTAGGGEEYDNANCGVGSWWRMGVASVTCLHTKDPAEADTEEFVEPIKEATAVWFNGGRQWHIADSFLGTLTEKEFWGVLERGGVIGGSSAGATIQGSYLVRGDTSGNTIMMGDHEVGFGYLKNTAIDQHVLRRNRQFDLIEVIETHPGLLGIGIDENTAIVVQGDEFEVIGQSYVLIYDNQTMVGDGGRFYFIPPGGRFNLATREATRGGRNPRPVQGPRPQPWPGIG